MYKVFLFCCLCLADAYLNDGLLSISITRHHKGDVYSAQGEKCFEEQCLRLTSQAGSSECECKCTSNRPVFRDDLQVCVDDIKECSLLPFVSGGSFKKIPYVFLPLKGQIVYPSAEVIISDSGAPVCVVSGGQFLGRSGWLDLRNNSGEEPPFRLFRDEGRTYLQWLGETSLRMAMEGRIILVNLMCKDASVAEGPKIFTPCIAFRVAGNPSVREVMFATDVHLKEEYSGGLSLREYVAIGICSLLLAVVYVASVFLYLHWRRRKKIQSKKSEEDARLTLGEEGIIKNNPLLQANRRLIGSGEDNAGYISDSNSCSSDADQCSDLLCLDEDSVANHQNVQTSAIVHPCDADCAESILYQDANNIEKLPEENVSIVETLELKDEHSETAKAMGCGNGRRKLYFNPSYFEPDLLKAPPPAALEFLMKIREVIAIAKHKMSAKKFSPSLLGIPEEDGSQKAENKSGSSVSPFGSRDIAADDGERKRTSQEGDEEDRSVKGRVDPKEFYCSMDTKQKIIRKWLEDVPFMMQPESQQSNRKVDFEPIRFEPKMWTTSEDADAIKLITNSGSLRQEKKRPSTKGKAPPPPKRQINERKEIKPDFSNFLASAGKLKIISSVKPIHDKNTEKTQPPSPPPLPCFEKDSTEVPRIQGKDRVPPVVAKNLMDAVIQELTGYKKNDKPLKLKYVEKETQENLSEKNETEKETITKKMKMPDISKADVQKEDISWNDVNKVVTTETEANPQDDHEYEVILLTSDKNYPSEKKSEDLKIYNLPEILSKNERSEGYSLVSEVYVNDGYSCCSGESPPGSFSSVESDAPRSPIFIENPGRLTIHVNDIPGQYKDPCEEVDNFEPDTLDRKPQKSRFKKKINDVNSEKYSNQRFHDMERQINSNEEASNENFTDSLERPSIMLKTNGSFNRNSIEKNIDDLLRNFTWSKVENFGSLREIYEAKSKNYRRSDTTSLTDFAHSDTDRVSTLSWSEERRNKLLHRGIVLHVDGERSRRSKNRFLHCGKGRHEPSTKAPERPPKPSTGSQSRSQSPCIAPASSPKSSCYSTSLNFLQSVTTPRTISPPLPPPRSFPASPSSPRLRSGNSSPVTSEITICKSESASSTPPLHSPRNSLIRGGSKSSLDSSCFSLTHTSSIDAPCRPPREPVNNPPLPPRNAKPPLPPKTFKGTVQKSPSAKFATRPLPPLPSPRPPKEISPSSPLPCKDVETLSTMSGASLDSLNSSEYEAFYTLPYEEEENGVLSCKNSTGVVGLERNPNSRASLGQKNEKFQNQRWLDSEGKKWQPSDGVIPHRIEDSGYLSTDSGDSCCPAPIFLSTSFSRIPEKVESYNSQNSETEESICDGASESGAESTTTDSFFYGHFQKAKVEKCQNNNSTTEIYPYSLRLSDVEVNSDTERHCVPIMVRP